MLTGIAHWDTLGNDAPVANALKAIGYNRLRFVVTVGALSGMVSSAAGGTVWAGAHLVRDVEGPAPPGSVFEVHWKHETPHISTWIAGVFTALPAGVWDIGTLGDPTNIGTLFAFIVVSAGVIILRRTNPEWPRGFRVPWVPFLPVLSILSCFTLTLSLPLETWIRFVVWLLIGIVIYFFYSRKRTANAASTPRI